MKFQLCSLPISEISGNNLARSRRTEKCRQQLFDSVRKFGVLQPVLVHKKPDGLHLIAGFGRVEAAQAAGLTHIAAQVFEGEISEVDLLILACNENSVREAMSFLDQADTLERVVKAKRITDTEAGKLLGLSQSVTSKIMSANAGLDDQVKLMLSQAGISYSTAYILSKAPPEQQVELCQRMIAEKWTRAQLENEMKAKPTRSLSYGEEVKCQLSYPVDATYEVIKAHLKRLMDEVVRCERLNVPFNLLSKMVQQ